MRPDPPTEGTRRARPLCVAVVLAALTACGGVSDPATPQPGGLKPYPAKDEALFADAKTPTPDGRAFSLGYSSPSGALPAERATQEGFCAQTRDLGGTCVVQDAAGRPTAQAAQVKGLVAEHVDAIGVSPLDPGALAAAVMLAGAARIPVVAAEMPPDVTQPAAAGVSANISQALDYSAWATMTAVARAMPGAHFGLLGTSAANPFARYLLAREQYWATQQGLVLAGTVEAQSDDARGWASAATALVQAHPEATLVVTSHDAAAVAASAAVRPDVKVADANGYTAAGRQAIQDGRMVASYAVPWDAKGRMMASAAYRALTGRRERVAPVQGVRGQVVTAANVATVPTVG